MGVPMVQVVDDADVRQLQLANNCDLILRLAEPAPMVIQPDCAADLRSGIGNGTNAGCLGGDASRPRCAKGRTVMASAASANQNTASSNKTLSRQLNCQNFDVKFLAMSHGLVVIDPNSKAQPVVCGSDDQFGSRL